MNKEKFFKKNDDKFLGLGFEKDELDPMFYYSKSLVSDEEIEENGMDEDDVPKLLFGNTGINRGFCVYTGVHFVWLGCATPEEAIKFSENIVAFEEC
jgi:hypothetical protein